MFEGAPNYKSVHYFTAPSSPCPEPEWDPNYRYGMLLTGCNDEFGGYVYGPSDCFWLIPGTCP